MRIVGLFIVFMTRSLGFYSVGVLLFRECVREFVVFVYISRFDREGNYTIFLMVWFNSSSRTGLKRYIVEEIKFVLIYD